MTESFKFKMHFRNTIYKVALERNWTEAEPDEAYNFAWLEKHELQDAYKKNAAFVNSKNFFINHFSNHQTITRKDLLATNINKTLRILQKFAPSLLQQFTLMPDTYILPQNWSQFQNKKDNQTTYIVKPANQAQGRGIFMAKYFEILNWYRTDYPEICKQAEAQDTQELKSGIQLYLVQKYVSQPLLINQHKFDLRLYVLVRSFQPLNVWLCRQGFARFALTKYGESKDNSAHLTNIAIQKHVDGYDKSQDGAKWTIQDLNEYMCICFGQNRTQVAFKDTEMLILRILQIAAPLMHQNKCSFEIYGFDVMFDDLLKPSILEVNACPSMSADTQEDNILKKQMLHDAISIITDETKCEYDIFGCWHRLYYGSTPTINADLFKEGQEQAQKLLDQGVVTSGVQLGDQVNRVNYLVQ